VPGLKVVVIVQLLPVAKLAPQLLDSLKLFAPVPPTTMLEISNLTLPVLENDTYLGELDDPAITEPNTTEAVDVSAAAGEVIGMSVVEPHPKLHAKNSDSAVVVSNIETKQRRIGMLPKSTQIIYRIISRKLQCSRNWTMRDLVILVLHNRSKTSMPFWVRASLLA
jgi:hypothetical protein